MTAPMGSPRSIFPGADKAWYGLPAGHQLHRSVQIDPIVPCDVLFNLTVPDGSKRTAQGKVDSFGYFTSKKKWSLDQPDVWTYTVNATWNGFKGRVPGLVDQGGYIFVLENGSQGGPGMKLNLYEQQTFSLNRRPGDSREQQLF